MFITSVNFSIIKQLLFDFELLLTQIVHRLLSIICCLVYTLLFARTKTQTHARTRANIHVHTKTHNMRAFIFFCTACPFRCSKNSRCIPQKNVCDGKPHCPDGQDEDNCRKFEQYYKV